MGRILEHGHGRISQALLCVVVALLACSTLIMGSFSRFGPGLYIVVALFLLVFIKIVESSVADPVRGDPNMWPLVYLPFLCGLMIYVFQQALTSGSIRLRPKRKHAEGPRG